MKKLVSYLSLLSISTNTILVIGCQSNLTNYSGKSKQNSPTNNEKNIEYYLKKLKIINSNLKKLNSDIQDIKSKNVKIEICGSNRECEEWKILLAGVKTELYNYYVEREDCHYQILCLKHKIFSSKEKIEANKILTSELKFLYLKLKFMKKVSDFSETDFNKILEKITEVKNELEKFSSSRERT